MSLIQIVVNVSIIIPVYNVSPFIEDCLRSVMRQTYLGDMECLIIDDCGTDESIPIAERLISEYEGSIRFKIIRHEHNRGLSAARNTGMERSQGEYIFFVDSDDEITDDCIEKMMAVVERDPSIDLVQGRCLRHSAGGQALAPRELRVAHASSNEAVRTCFYEKCQIMVPAWNKLMKRSLIQENHLTFIEGLLYEDAPWTFYWLKCVNNAYFLPEVTYHYKIRPKSIMTGSSGEAIASQRIKGYSDIVSHLTPGYERQEAEHYLGSFVGVFLSHSYHMPALTEDLRFFRAKARQYKIYKYWLILSLCYIFRKVKWSDRTLSLLVKLRHPRLLLPARRQG